MKNTPPATPVVILRKKRPAAVAPVSPLVPTPAALQFSKHLSSTPENPAPQPKSGQAKPEVPTVVPASALIPQKSPPTASPPSPYTDRQRRIYERRQRFIQSPEFAQIIETMITRWPHLFRVTPDTIRPLAIGIAHDLCTHLADFDPKLVHHTLRQWMADHRVPYWKALMRGGPRYDLEGNPRGEVTPEQQQEARKQRKAWFDRRNERRNAKTVEGGPATSPAELPTSEQGTTKLRRL